MALKVVWLSGGTIGVADVSMMREPSMIALNAVTAGMDLVAIVIAMAFTHRWGLRIPAWLVLPPDVGGDRPAGQVRAGGTRRHRR